MDERSRARQFQQQNLVDVPAPLAPGPASQVAARYQSGLIVVRAEIRRARMRNVDGDERDARLDISRGNGRRDRFVGLELERQIEVFSHQLQRVVQRDLRLIPIVHDDQLDASIFCGSHQP